MCARQSCAPFPRSSTPVCLSASPFHRLLCHDPDPVKVTCDLSCQSAGQFSLYSTSQKYLTQLSTFLSPKRFLHMPCGTPVSSCPPMSLVTPSQYWWSLTLPWDLLSPITMSSPWMTSFRPMTPNSIWTLIIPNLYPMPPSESRFVNLDAYLKSPLAYLIGTSNLTYPILIFSSQTSSSSIVSHLG